MAIARALIYDAPIVILDDIEVKTINRFVPSPIVP
ncbi:hypothetical protein [Acetivibrio ethanolgignens]